MTSTWLGLYSTTTWRFTGITCHSSTPNGRSRVHAPSPPRSLRRVAANQVLTATESHGPVEHPVHHPIGNESSRDPRYLRRQRDGVARPRMLRARRSDDDPGDTLGRVLEAIPTLPSVLEPSHEIGIGRCRVLGGGGARRIPEAG